MIFQTFPRNSQSIRVKEEKQQQTHRGKMMNLERASLLFHLPHLVHLAFLSFLLEKDTLLQCSCLWNPMDGGAWWVAVHGVTKSQTRLSDFTFTFHFHALENEMATHSSVLAWRIPGTGSLVGCRLWGRPELDTTEVTSQQQQSFLPPSFMSFFLPLSLPLFLSSFLPFPPPPPPLSLFQFLSFERKVIKKKKITSKIKSQTWTLEFCLSP